MRDFGLFVKSLDYLCWILRGVSLHPLSNFWVILLFLVSEQSHLGFRGEREIERAK